MDFIPSFHKLTFDPGGGTELVVVDFDQWIDQELALSLSKACEVVAPVDAKDIFIQDQDASSWTGTVKAFFTEDLDMTARIKVMRSHITAFRAHEKAAAGGDQRMDRPLLPILQQLHQKARSGAHDRVGEVPVEPEL